MRALLLGLANASFVLSQCLAFIGWVLDIVFRYSSCLLADAALWLRERAPK